ncbi:hypothetical protein LF1_55640 [Rubripirellula obstinata]|uniref:Uncharacterized protein n=1 Tax=Rubripirellula obstinata TaxID=406547 RepID=A0A5B1CCU5_9BACT|nr:hypothetical protein LF1_55640 [Rubripirellula obstinata]
MTDPNRHNCVNIHHHYRDDTVVLLPHVSFLNGGSAFGDGAILPRSDANLIGDAILRMLDHSATADTRPLVERRTAAMERSRRGFELTFDEQCPSFDIPDNWGRIYERYPVIILDPRVSARYFAQAIITDCTESKLLAFEHLQLPRKGHAIYSTAHSEIIDRSTGPASVGKIVSDRLHTWRPKRGFLARLVG